MIARPIANVRLLRQAQMVAPASRKPRRRTKGNYVVRMPRRGGGGVSEHERPVRKQNLGRCCGPVTSSKNSIITAPFAQLFAKMPAYGSLGAHDVHCWRSPPSVEWGHVLMPIRDHQHICRDDGRRTYQVNRPPICLAIPVGTSKRLVGEIQRVVCLSKRSGVGDH
jgi:hypothetical protein